MSVVAPITDFSAEFQAIAFAQNYEGTEIVFVDRDVDHIFQWRPSRETEEALPEPEEEVDEDAQMHGAAVGVELGSTLPSFGDFVDFLLTNARVGTFGVVGALRRGPHHRRGLRDLPPRDVPGRQPHPPPGLHPGAPGDRPQA
ncbi:MAG: hypothetical protein H6740_27330 [Alphaproteobacteria bacterium]|nr:hypothetical protein [Alphaproteobacteria bacterium]